MKKAADEWALASPDQTRGRDVRHSVEERILERVDSESPAAGLEHTREHTVGDREAASYGAGATDEVIERKRVWSRRRRWRRYRSKSTRQHRTRALNHD